MNCHNDIECADICTALEIANSWNVPACGSQAVLAVPGSYMVLIGAYIWNPTYGWFRITQFDSVNRQVTVMNECITNNAAPGTVVPAGTLFVFGAPPGATAVTFSRFGAGSAYTLTTANAQVVMGTVSPEITLSQPGTYLVFGGMEVVNTNLQTSGNIVISGGMRRINNTPLDINAHNIMSVLQPGSSYTLTLGYRHLIPAIYTTTNANDILGLAAYYSGVITGGSLQVSNGYMRAVKLY